LADGSIRIIIPRNAKIPVQETTIVYNSVTAESLQVDLYQGDNLLASQNEHIGQLIYEYGREVAAGKGEVIVGITVESAGTIRFSCKELLKAPVEVVLARDGSRV
jgi:molecular chaperone DnaK/molecular chaperone HscA